jgi:hypothetical protein
MGFFLEVSFALFLIEDKFLVGKYHIYIPSQHTEQYFNPVII